MCLITQTLALIVLMFKLKYSIKTFVCTIDWNIKNRD